MPIDMTDPSYTQQFNSAGTFSYHCNIHPSMFGTIVVGDVFQFTASTASVNEGDPLGQVQVMVKRLGAGTGAASVHYTTVDGTATAPADYTTTSGTLNWAASDTANKPITVPIVDDGGTGEGDSTFSIELSSPSADGALGTPASITVTIHGNDPPPPTYQPDLLVKGPTNTTYKGDNVCNTLAGQTTSTRVAKGKSATFYAKLQNDGNVSDTYAIKGKASTSSFSIRYFRGTTNITNAVVGGSETTGPVAAGKSWTMRVMIAPKAAATVGAVIRDIVSGHSNTDTTKKDAVELREVVRAS
jgi:Calx-beta domain